MLNSSAMRLLLAAALLVLAACHEVYLRPTASSGERARVYPPCPGALSVIQFAPSAERWVHLRVYVERSVRPDFPSRLVVELYSDPKEGLSFWGWHSNPEYVRRRDRQYEFRAESPQIVLTYPDGQRTVLTSKLLTGVHHLESRTTRLASEQFTISDGPIDEFSIELPAVNIDGERVEIPPVHFSLDGATYMPVINC
jgi:hypothetical protein